MVWGMNMPASLGEFWPDGAFAGWSERLQAHYHDRMPDDQKALFDDDRGNGAGNYAHYASGKFLSEVGAVSGSDRPPFAPIAAHEPPTSFVTAKTYTSLGSPIMVNDRILAVDETLKTIIDRLEPGVHQFFPIEIRMPKGRVYPTAYFVLVIGQHLDSFDAASSKAGSFSEPAPGYYTHQETKKGVTGLAFSKAKFGDAHLWRERGVREWLTCFSDELQSAIASAGLNVPKHYRMIEVDAANALRAAKEA